MTRTRLLVLLILIIGLTIGYFVYTTEKNSDSKFGFKLGLDLSGGIHLIYIAGTSNLKTGATGGALQPLLGTKTRVLQVNISRGRIWFLTRQAGSHWCRWRFRVTALNFLKKLRGPTWEKFWPSFLMGFPYRNRWFRKP